MIEYLAIFGFMVMLCLAAGLLTCLYHEIKRVHQVAKHYEAVQSKVWYRKDWFQQYDEKIKECQSRLYRAETKASNAAFTIDHHIRDNKHTQTAKAIKRDKARKQAEEDYRGGVVCD